MLIISIATYRNTLPRLSFKASLNSAWLIFKNACVIPQKMHEVPFSFATQTGIMGKNEALKNLLPQIIIKNMHEIIAQTHCRAANNS